MQVNAYFLRKKKKKETGMYPRLDSWESCFFPEVIYSTNSPAPSPPPPLSPPPPTPPKTSSPAAREQGCVTGAESFAWLPPRGKGAGAAAGGGGGVRKGRVLQGAPLACISFYSYRCCFISLLLRWENVRRVRIGEALLQKPWAWAFFPEEKS